MALIHADVFLDGSDRISAHDGKDGKPVLWLGQLTVFFASAEQMGAVRHAIDAHLANRFAMAVPAPEPANA
jgi:hypothetical protein